MTATMPKIQVFNKKNPAKTTIGLADRVAVVGAFDSEITEPKVYEDLDSANADLGTDVTYKGCAVLPFLFNGASSVLAVNITTKSGQTVNKEITTANLTSALAKIKNERFDILFVADALSDTFIPIITTFTDERYLNKIPCGFIGVASRTNLSEYSTTKQLLTDACYGIVTEQVKYENDTLALLQTGAYYCGLVASTNIGSSLTQKTLPGVTGLVNPYTFEDGDLGKSLVGLGYTVFQCYDRLNDEYVIVNSEQPNGLDLYINRVRDYVIREFALHDFLGERNNDVTYSEIEQEIDRVKAVCIDNLNLLKDIEFNIVKKSAKCVDINITKLLFDEVITDMNVFITIEVN